MVLRKIIRFGGSVTTLPKGYSKTMPRSGNRPPNARRHSLALQKYEKVDGDKWVIDTSKDRGSVRLAELKVGDAVLSVRRSAQCSVAARASGPLLELGPLVDVAQHGLRVGLSYPLRGRATVLIRLQLPRRLPLIA